MQDEATRMYSSWIVYWDMAKGLEQARRAEADKASAARAILIRACTTS